MKTVCKTGSVDSIVEGVKEELAGCNFFIYCADDPRFSEISSKLRKAMPNTQMIGTTGIMFNGMGGMKEGFCALGFTEDDAEIYVFSLRKIDTCPIKYLPGLIWSSEEILKRHKKENTICLEFTTGHEERVVSTMKVALERVGMRLVGGTAGNTEEGKPKKVSCNGKILNDSAVYAVIGSKMGKIEVFKENIFHPRKRNHIVTKASEDGRTIMEIDHRKAVDVYEEELGYTDANVEQGIFNNPLTKCVGDENYVMAMIGFNKDRSITTYKNVQENDMICFTDIDKDFKQYIENCCHDAVKGRKVEAIVSINCILRYLFFEKSGFTEKYDRLMNSIAAGKHLGIVSDGEQYIEQHVNQSMVCAMFTRDN